MFKLFTNLLCEPDISAKNKRIISAVIAYFVAPIDAIPEERTGSWGYLDDVFLAAWSVKKLEKELGYGILEENWGGEGDLREVASEIYGTASSWLKGMEEDILRQVGLDKKDFRGVK